MIGFPITPGHRIVLMAIAGWFLVAETLRAKAAASELVFGGHRWSVRSGQGGPGPNRWDPQNVWLDASNRLHLKIALRDGAWSCAEVTLLDRLGFGQYQFATVGRVDQFDEQIVLGLFNYPTGDVGPDGTHEIDVELARWGNSRNPVGNFTVWPAEKGLRQTTHPFPVVLADDQSTYRFDWSRERIDFRAWAGLRSDPGSELARWVYQPTDAARRIAAKPMPVHMNLWLFQGKPPKNGREVEVVIQDFHFKPATEGK